MCLRTNLIRRTSSNARRGSRYLLNNLKWVKPINITTLLKPPFIYRRPPRKSWTKYWRLTSWNPVPIQQTGVFGDYMWRNLTSEKERKWVWGLFLILDHSIIISKDWGTKTIRSKNKVLLMSRSHEWLPPDSTPGPLHNCTSNREVQI